MRTLTPFQLAQVAFAFAVILATVIVCSGCVSVYKTNNFYIMHNDLGDVGVKGVDERIEEIERDILGE
jgi:hypothetical protein